MSFICFIENFEMMLYLVFFYQYVLKRVRSFDLRFFFVQFCVRGFGLFSVVCERLAFLVRLYYLFVLFMFQCLIFRREVDGSEILESFVVEVKFFTEFRLFQRDVQIILESCYNQNILGIIFYLVSVFVQIGLRGVRGAFGVY